MSLLVSKSEKTAAGQMVATGDQELAAGSNSFLGCGYCNEAFPTKDQLEAHEKMTHPDKPYSAVPAPMPDREQALLHKAPIAAISKKMPLSEVNRHCVPADCWVAVNGKVYDLTEFMDRHPGGPTVILSAAGKDASKIYNDIHKGVKIEQYLRPEAILGDLGVDEELMSDSFWHTLRKARIHEIKEELERLMTTDGVPNNRATNVAKLLKMKELDADLKNKLQRLETQKRVALDSEDYAKALEIKTKVDSLLVDAELKIACQQFSGGIPLSEVAHHNKPHDCWIAFNGMVYDLTDFLIHHQDQRNVVLAWAGRDASEMWDRIPGRFPSSTWCEFYMRPEMCMGDVGPEPPMDPKTETIHMLETELHRLEGPSEEDIQAAKAGANRVGAAVTSVSTLSEEARFPKLKEIVAGKGTDLPFFTRAEVAKHKGPPGGAPGTEPYMILHNKVYDLTPFLGSHPGGDDLLLSRAGTDATKDFELFEHSEKARIRRDKEMLVGQLVPAECTDWAAEASAVVREGAVDKAGSEFSRYLRYKAADAAVVCVAWYAYMSYQNRKPLTRFMYSRGLRHMHLLMALGIFASLGSAHLASRAEGLAKKRFLAFHKQTGLAMLVGLVVRAFLRLRSAIPPRFPGHPAVQFVESQSLRAFYLILFALPVSGIVSEYFQKWAPGSEQTGAEGDDERNDRLAMQAMTFHKRVGKFFEFVWLPFHLGYTTAYHYSRGRGVVRKVSPFI